MRTSPSQSRDSSAVIRIDLLTVNAENDLEIRVRPTTGKIGLRYLRQSNRKVFRCLLTAIQSRKQEEQYNDRSYRTSFSCDRRLGRPSVSGLPTAENFNGIQLVDKEGNIRKPAFGRAESADHIWDLVDYVRTLPGGLISEDSTK